MEEAGNAAEGAALGAFAAARRAEEDVGLVFHERISFVSQKCDAAQPIRCRLANRMLLLGDRLDIDATPRPVEPHLAVDESENRVIPAQAYVPARKKLRPALANDDV